MTVADLTSLLLLPIGLGLFGFIEPCSIGSSLVFIKTMEGRSASAKLGQAAIFALTRALFIGLLGALAALVGSAFLGWQQAAWVVLGLLYAAIGLLYLTGQSGRLMVMLGPRLQTLSSVKGSATLGFLFGLNIPACAAPLLLALLTGAAASGVTGATLGRGFVSLSLFGLALSLPLLAIVLFPAAGRLLDRLAGLSRRLPFWTGLVMLALGLWSIWFGFFTSVKSPA